MTRTCDLVVIGAGPYGLSIGAHALARGVDVRVLGRPMESWREHMPRDMYLKSEGFASNLSDPDDCLPLSRFCVEEGFGYGDYGHPVALDTFLSYGLWFQKQAGIDVEDLHVTRVDAAGDLTSDVHGRVHAFNLTTDDGPGIQCRSVVIAVGGAHFAYRAPSLHRLPAAMVSHSQDHVDFSRFAGRQVAVIGGGQSGLETAALLAERGAEPIVVVRARKVAWNPSPYAEPRPLRRRLRAPRSGLGDGWDCVFFERAPRAFRRLPVERRLQTVATTFGPAGAWWLKPRVVDRVAILAGWDVVSAEPQGDLARLVLCSASGERQVLSVDHVISATGYRPDVTQLPFLSSPLVSAIRTVGPTSAPALSSGFESSVPALHFAGVVAAPAFGPVMRFVLGARFTARQVVRSVIRRR